MTSGTQTVRDTTDGLSRRSGRCRALGVTVLVLAGFNVLQLMLDLWGLTLFGSAVDYQRAGTVAEWFTGVVTLGVVIVAALTLRSDRERHETQRRQRELEAEQAHERAFVRSQLRARARAGQVYSWLQPRWDYTARRIEVIECHLENRTQTPIYLWSLKVEACSVALDSKEAGPILPGSSVVELSAPEWKALAASKLLPRVQLTFEAANSEILRRDFDGALVAVQEHGVPHDGTAG